MKLIRILFVVVACCFLYPLNAASKEAASDEVTQPIDMNVGSFSFSGTVVSESGETYGYFLQMSRKEDDFAVKAALIDKETNELKLYYEDKQTLSKPKPFDWHVGHSFVRYNPINDSWVFGVKLEGNQGFNFKADMLKNAKKDYENLVLRPGIELQAIQTSRVNGHLQTESNAKEQFVTGNTAWFGKVWFSKKQKSQHMVHTTFCHLANENGFYSANLKEADATGASFAGWVDEHGNKMKMSQFVSYTFRPDNQCSLYVGLPKVRLTLKNTLHDASKKPALIAGFSKDHKDFCFLANQFLS